MARFTAEQVAQKMIDRVSGATQAMTDGANAVKVAPTASAAKASDRWLARVTAAKGKFEAGCNRVTLQDWQSAYITKGIQRIPAGIAAARPKIVAFYAKFLPFLDGVSAQVKAMPNVTLQDSINRMIKQVTEVSKFKM